jgi:hypothetical protein
MKPFSSQVVTLSIIGMFFFAPTFAHAATLYLSPSSLTLSSGQTGTFSVYASSPNQALNAVSGTVAVDTAGLSLVSGSKAGSIITFWASEPVANTSSGQFSFEGVVLTPGYTGSSAKIASFTVRAKTAGTYSARFLSGSVLANDGLGTDITQGTSGGTVTVKEGVVAPANPESKSVSTGLPPAPVVASVEFPSRDTWYVKTAGTFTWRVPTDVTAVRTLLDQNKSSVPSILLDGRVAERKVNDIPEGVNYFHVQFKNAKGWGEVAHVRIQVDTTAPELTALKVKERSDSTDPNVRMNPDATDELSGIAGFEASIDGREYIKMKDSAGSVSVGPLSPGVQKVSVRAIDGAGNVSTPREFSVTIEPLTAPIITFVTDSIKEDEPFVVSGTALVPGTTAHLLISQKGTANASGEVTVAQDGTFSFLVSKGTPSGTYQLSVYITDERGARSLPSNEVTRKVTGKGLTGWLLLLAQIVGALVALGSVIALGWWILLLLGKKLLTKQRDLLVEIKEADTTTQKVFTLLRKDIDAYVTHLEKVSETRALTKSEQAFVDGVREDLESSEQLIRKEIKDVAVVAKKATRKKKVPVVEEGEV